MAKILAVDDEPAILEMIESILNKDGHLVTKVSNPLKINMEELHRYDLILLDIMMPGIDGFDMLIVFSGLLTLVTRCPSLFKMLSIISKIAGSSSTASIFAIVSLDSIPIFCFLPSGLPTKNSIPY